MTDDPAARRRGVEHEQEVRWAALIANAARPGVHLVREDSPNLVGSTTERWASVSPACEPPGATS